VYGNRPRALQGLRNNLETEIQAITPEALHRTFRNMEPHVKYVWKPKVDTFTICCDGHVFNMKQGTCVINFMLLNILVGKLYRHVRVRKLVGHPIQYFIRFWCNVGIKVNCFFLFKIIVNCKLIICF
jgi:hypothetical protein